MKVEDIYNKLKEFIIEITKIDFPEAKVIIYTPSLFKHLIYYGEYGQSISNISSNNPLQVLRVMSLVKDITGTYMFSAGGNYKWFCYPEILGEDYIFYDTATDIALVLDVVQKIKVIDENGLSTIYNCYRSYNELNGPVTVSIKRGNNFIPSSSIYSQLPLITLKLDNFNRERFCTQQTIEQKGSIYQLSSLFKAECTANINLFSDKTYEAEEISNKIKLYVHSELKNKWFEDLIVISRIRNIDLSSEELYSDFGSVVGMVLELRYNDYTYEDIDIINKVNMRVKVNDRESTINI